MRMTIDIPGQLYRKLQAKAASEGSTVKQIIVDLLSRELQASDSGTRVSFPLIAGKARRKLRITSQEIDGILFG